MFPHNHNHASTTRTLDPDSPSLDLTTPIMIQDECDKAAAVEDPSPATPKTLNDPSPASADCDHTPSPFSFYYKADAERPAQILVLEDRIRKVEQVARRSLNIDPSTDVHVEFLRPRYLDFFDPVELRHTFKITTPDQEYHLLMRYQPGHGHVIESQIASMDCIRQNTDVFRVPMVLAHDTSDDNELGRSWMIREYLPGEDLVARWRPLCPHQKQSIAEDLARYTAQLYRIRFDKIGSLMYDHSDDASKSTPRRSSLFWSLVCALWAWLWWWFSWISPRTARLVSLVSSFFLLTAKPSLSKIVVGEDSTIYKPTVPRGPFTRSHDWFQARLQQFVFERAVLAEALPGRPLLVAYDTKYAAETLRWIKFIQQPPSLRRKERFTTVYHPVKASSIIISDDGTVGGLLDWDSVCVCPPWATIANPDVTASDHSDGEMTVEECFPTPLGPELTAIFLDAREKSRWLDMENRSLDDALPDLPREVRSAICTYWHELSKYEKTQMRYAFVETMKEVAPAWIDLADRRKRDIAIAIGVRLMVRGDLTRLSEYSEEHLSPFASDNVSEASWPSDEETSYGHSDRDSDCEV